MKENIDMVGASIVSVSLVVWFYCRARKTLKADNSDIFTAPVVTILALAVVVAVALVSLVFFLHVPVSTALVFGLVVFLIAERY